ncbi:hypothetical protein JR316_0009347 [Psilocybe cubensis]|uniref:Uncharacterized protein n=1 Tax=Psilocybe cubensis TaxID=181762 RepID=A0ACB8GT37_PSICU|nr:hypothetical protein JR316_0009347 [Psilocybe cubensis]KAH9478885.1 hypothetical protein JR316_0009347 [Psilocybe cubensis]
MQGLMPDLMDIIKKCKNNSALIGKVIDLVSSAAAHLQSNNLFKAHELIPELIPYDLRVLVDLQAYKLACPRVNQGYKHPAYAALLIPRVKSTKFTYLNAHKILQQDPRSVLTILGSPNEANRLGERASKGQIHKVYELTIRLICYYCMVLVIAISGKTWPEAKSILKANHLYTSILTLLLGLSDDDTWAKETVAWWQENIILPSEPVDPDKKSSPLEGSARNGCLRDPVEWCKAQMATAAHAPAPARAPAPKPACAPTPTPASAQARAPSSAPAPYNVSAPALSKAFAAVLLAEPVPKQVSRCQMILNTIGIPSKSHPDLPSKDSSSLSSKNKRSPSPSAPIMIKISAKRKAVPHHSGPKRKDAPPSDPFKTGDEALSTPNSDATATNGEEPPAKKAKKGAQTKEKRQSIKCKARKF